MGCLSVCWSHPMFSCSLRNHTPLTKKETDRLDGMCERRLGGSSVFKMGIQVCDPLRELIKLRKNIGAFKQFWSQSLYPVLGFVSMVMTLSGYHLLITSASCHEICYPSGPSWPPKWSLSHLFVFYFQQSTYYCLSFYFFLLPLYPASKSHEARVVSCLPMKLQSPGVSGLVHICWANVCIALCQTLCLAHCSSPSSQPRPGPKPPGLLQ